MKCNKLYCDTLTNSDFSFFSFWWRVIYAILSKANKTSTLKFTQHCVRALTHSALPRAHGQSEYEQFRVHDPYCDCFTYFSSFGHTIQGKLPNYFLEKKTKTVKEKKKEVITAPTEVTAKIPILTYLLGSFIGIFAFIVRASEALSPFYDI